VCHANGEIDVRAQRLQWHRAIDLALGAGDFRAA
jgi:hypothetical protein